MTKAIGSIAAITALVTALAGLISALNGSPIWTLLERPTPTAVAIGVPTSPPVTVVPTTAIPSACASTGVLTLRCEVLTNLTGHQGAVWALSFDRPGTQLLSGGYQDSTAITWTTTNDPRQAKKLANGSPLFGTAPVLAAAWSPTSDRIVATGAADGMVRIWDAANGNETFALDKVHTDTVWSVAWDARGVYLASASSEIDVWAPGGDDKHKPITALRGLGQRVYSVAWIESNEAGGVVAAGLADGRIVLWDTRSGTETLLPADGTAIRSVAWSETARALASGSEDGAVHVWYRDTGRNVRLPEQHREAVYSVAWSADGGLLVSGSNDGAIKFWQATPQGVVRAGEFTDPAQRKQVFALGWGGSDLLAIGRQDWQVQLVRVTR